MGCNDFIWLTRYRVNQKIKIFNLPIILSGTIPISVSISVNPIWTAAIPTNEFNTLSKIFLSGLVMISIISNPRGSNTFRQLKISSKLFIYSSLNASSTIIKQLINNIIVLIQHWANLTSITIYCWFFWDKISHLCPLN